MFAMGMSVREALSAVLTTEVSDAVVNCFYMSTQGESSAVDLPTLRQRTF